MSARPKLPPYAARLPLDHTKVCSIFVSAGASAWSRGRAWATEAGRRPFFVVPPNEDPTTFRWDFVKGHEAIILWDSLPKPALDQIAIALALGGAIRVVAVGGGRIMRYQIQHRAAA